MNEGAALAMQIPAFHQMTISYIVIDTADRCFPKRFSAVRRVRNFSLQQYYDMFSRYFAQVTVWKTDYIHQFDNSDRIVEFVRGTALIPYMERLNDAECARKGSAFYGRIRVLSGRGRKSLHREILNSQKKMP